MLGSEEPLLIRTDGNLMKCIETEVRGSTRWVTGPNFRGERRGVNGKQLISIAGSA